MSPSDRWAIYQITGRRPARAPRRFRSGRGPARNWKYRAWIRTLPCAVCGSQHEIEAAHTGSDGGMALKASDYSCIPLCGDHHQLDGRRAYHGNGRNEWEQLHGVHVRELVKRLNHAWFAYSAEVK